MFFVYILWSEKCNRFYIGYTADLEARLLRHNSGLVTATKNCRPYIIQLEAKCWLLLFASGERISKSENLFLFRRTAFLNRLFLLDIINSRRMMRKAWHIPINSRIRIIFNLTFLVYWICLAAFCLCHNNSLLVNSKDYFTSSKNHSYDKLNR